MWRNVWLEEDGLDQDRSLLVLVSMQGSINKSLLVHCNNVTSLQLSVHLNRSDVSHLIDLSLFESHDYAHTVCGSLRHGGSTGEVVVSLFLNARYCAVQMGRRVHNFDKHVFHMMHEEYK